MKTLSNNSGIRDERCLVPNIAHTQYIFGIQCGSDNGRRLPRSIVIPRYIYTRSAALPQAPWEPIPRDLSAKHTPGQRLSLEAERDVIFLQKRRRKAAAQIQGDVD